MDIHIVETEKLNAEDVVKAHMKDLTVQERHGVIQRKYWVDTGNKRVFCLMEGPNKEACNAVHAEAHGMTACNIVEVSEDEYNLMITGHSKNDLAYMDNGQLDPGLRTMLWIDFKDFSGKYSHYSGELIQIIQNHKGHIIPQGETHTFGIFNSPINAVICAITITQFLKEILGQIEYKLFVVSGQLLEKDSKELFSESKEKMVWIQYLGQTNQVFLDERTRQLIINHPHAPKISFTSVKVLNENHFTFLKHLFSTFKKELTKPTLSIGQLNKDLGMSKATSYRTISSLTGMSPSRLLQEFRLQLALEMLKKKEKSVSEIAYQLGFNSASYFTRTFKNRYGILPTSFTN